MRLDRQAVVVTGAAGIAAASARRAAAEGAELFIVSIDEEECRALAADLERSGRGVGWAAADLREESDAARAFGSALESMGRIDGLVAVAGGSGRRFGDGPVDQVPLAGWEATMRLNLTTTFLSAREAIRGMLAKGRGGSVVLVGSVLATSPSPVHFATHAYAASKGAISTFARSAASRYASEGIRVNVVAPGLVHTPMAQRAASDPLILDYARRKQPLAEGLIEPEDIAGSVVFLLSDSARLVTGQTLMVDGGWGVTEVGS